MDRRARDRRSDARLRRRARRPRASTCTSRRARSSPCSVPTVPARPPPCSTVSGLLADPAGDDRGFRAIGCRPTAPRVARDGLAHVPEDRSLFFKLTVREHLRSARPRAARSRVALLPGARARWSSRRAGLLSGGEQQMLAIGRALAAAPAADGRRAEPRPRTDHRRAAAAGAADGRRRHRVPAVLLVEQHVNLALEVADRAYVLSHGDVVLEGRRPTSRADRHLLESSYMGQSEIAAAEEEQEEIEQALEAAAPSGEAGTPPPPPLVRARLALTRRLSGRYLAEARAGLVSGETFAAARRASGRRPSWTARSHPGGAACP